MLVFLQELFGHKRNVRDTTDAELKAIMVPLGNLIVDFNEKTNVSWLVILPTVQKIAAQLLVSARGLESARIFYAAGQNDIYSTQTVPTGAVLGVSPLSVSPDQIAELNARLWAFANGTIAKGVPVEHVAQAFGIIVVVVSEKVVDRSYTTFLLRAQFEELMSDDFHSSSGQNQ